VVKRRLEQIAFILIFRLHVIQMLGAVRPLLRLTQRRHAETCSNTTKYSAAPGIWEIGC
jgi:hypothetical protein